MKTKLFFVFLVAIIVFGIISRFYAISGNRIFFTVDEGRDAVYVRQILNYHQIFTKGPESSVRGIFTGPLWYYFIAIGYALIKGNPAGSVLMLVLLNISITVAVILILRKEVDEKISLIAGLGLMIFWSFFSTSLWGFNPFPLVALSFILILLLLKFIQTNKQKYYGWALLPIILAFNTELAGAIAFFLFYILAGGYFIFRKKLNLRNYFIFAFLIPGIGIAKIVFDYLRQPKNPEINAGLKVLSGTNFKQMGIEFMKMIGTSSIPQNVYLGFLVIIVIIILYLRLTKKNIFIKNFIYSTFTLIITSFFFFASNHGWRSWHTVYIPPIILVAVLSMCYELKLLGKILIGVILILQLISFRNNYLDYLKPSPNPSILYNQIKVLDWVYGNSEGNGFDLYTYTNSFYDYSYQYLVSWYGKTKYGFYPCEYSNFPLSIKTLYIPGWENYVEPKLGCDKFRFLIIDSDTNGNMNKDWINSFRSQTVFLEKVQIGGTTIEKRKVPDKIR